MGSNVSIISILKLLGLLCVSPLAFGILMLLLFIAYCILFGWLSLLPIFSWHFKVISKIWYLGLRIVLNGIVWRSAAIGALLLLIAKIFS